MKTEQAIKKRRKDFCIIFLHILLNFQLNSIKTQGGDTKKPVFWKMRFCEIWPFFAKTVKISLNLAKIWIFVISYYPFHGSYYFSDFQHHWYGFSEIMTQKVQKSAHFGPQIF